MSFYLFRWFSREVFNQPCDISCLKYCELPFNCQMLVGLLNCQAMNSSALVLLFSNMQNHL